MANSKLSREQKQDRKDMMDYFINQRNGFFFVAEGVTLLVVPLKMAMVSVSTCRRMKLNSGVRWANIMHCSA